MPMSDASVSVIDGRAVVRVSGSELLSPIVKQVTDAAASAADDREAAEIAAATSIAATRYFTTRAAGEAASTANQAFATDDGAGNVIYYKRTAGGSTEIGRAVTPASLAAASGSSTIGDQLAELGAVVRTQAQINAETISVNRFGAKGDGVTDDTAAINRAITVAAVRGGGQVNFGASLAGYKVTGTLLIPTGVVLDLCGQTLLGAGLSANTMIETAYLSGGTLISNLGSAPESRLVGYAAIRNGMIKDCAVAFHLRNFNFACSIENVSTFGARQFGKFERCFYMSMDNASARGPSDVAYPTFHFLDANNLINLRRVSATSASPFCFEGGSTGVTLSSCSGEGGIGYGIKFKGDCLGFTIDAGYWEAIQGVLFDFSEAGVCSTTFRSNYINLVDVIFNHGGDTATGTLFGTFDASNYLANIGSIDAGFTYRGLMKLAGARNFIDFELPYVNDSPATLPSNWLVDKSTRVTRQSGATGTSLTDIRSRSVLYLAGIAPITRVGDTGAPTPNTVSGGTHAPFAAGATSVTVLVTTKIAWQPDSCTAAFQFRVTDQSGGRSTKLAGTVYGDLVSRDDPNSAGFEVRAVNSNGFLRLELYGFTSPGGAYTCTGDVHIA